MLIYEELSYLLYIIPFGIVGGGSVKKTATNLAMKATDARTFFRVSVAKNSHCRIVVTNPF
jgi:hypothetical protein